MSSNKHSVIPAQAGIQLTLKSARLARHWIPAFAGMTALYELAYIYIKNCAKLSPQLLKAHAQYIGWLNA